MNLSDSEKEVKELLDSYVENKSFNYNPDEEVVERVIRGLSKRKDKSGYMYCPCRIVTGSIDKDRNIICPCEYHEHEIEEKGHCHCYLFVK